MTSAFMPLHGARRHRLAAAPVVGPRVGTPRRRGRRAVRRRPRLQPGRAAGQRVPPVRLRGDADRQDHVLRDRRARDGPDLGLHGHPVARARRVLRARRLRDGDVPDALDRARRRVQERPARLHGVPRLEDLPVVLELHRPLLVLRAAGRAGAGRARVRVRVLRVPVADQGRLLLDHHAGADLRVHAAVLPQRHGLRRQQRLHRLQADPRLPDHGAGDADGAVHAHRAPR